MAVVALFVFSLLLPQRRATRRRSSPATSPPSEDIATHPRQARPRPAASWCASAAGSGDSLHGDLGTSIFTNLPVADADRPARRADAVADAVHADRRGRARGAAGRASRPGARRHAGSTACVMAFAVLGFSVPVFVIAYLLILRVRASSSTGCRCRATRRFSEGFVAVGCEHLILPSRRARPRLHRADRPHHARHACSTCWRRTTSAPPAPRASRPARHAVRACAEERRGADRHRHRHRHRAADRRRGRHRDACSRSPASAA